MSTFQELGLSPNLLQGIEELGFQKPTAIQEKIIPLVYQADRDIVGLAQTGTGKTAAFGLPLIDQVDFSNKSVQVIVLAPTRELCMQIAKDLKNYSKHIKGFKILPVYGGASIDTQIRALKKGVHIVTATPGRMLDLIGRKAADLSKIKSLVLDEADEMLNMGFRDELDGILEQTPETKRTLLFSATMPKEVARIAKNYMNDPIEITVGKQNAGAENVQHIYYQVHAKDRYLALKRIADINPNIYGIVFCRTRMETKDVADKLIKDGYNADALHGDLSQSQRDLVMKKFREKTLQMLVATDVAARGIDVQDISHVINYNLPEDIDIYTHRSGRTGRAEKSGVAISIVNYREKSKMPAIEKIVGKKFNKQPVPTGFEICEKQLFSMIDKMENVEVDEEQIAPFMEVVNKKLSWLTKEQVIKHFVSLEFNRFLDYYKNAPDLNKSEEKSSSRGKDRDIKPRQSKTKYQRFFVSMGKKDNIEPVNIIGMVNDHTHDRDIHIGTIDILNNFSFFEVDEQHANKVLNALQKASYNGKDITVEFAENEKDRKPKSESKRRSGKREKELPRSRSKSGKNKVRGKRRR